MDPVPLRNPLLSLSGEAHLFGPSGASLIPEAVMPFFNQALNFAFPGVFTASVQRFPAETAIGPTVAADGSDRANWQEQAVMQQDFEAFVRDDG